MRMIITGIRDGKSCIAEEIDCTPDGEDLSVKTLLDLAPADQQPPIGRSEYRDLGVPPGMLRWHRVRFPANQLRPFHYTNTIDCHTIVSGSLDLLLDDGPHRLDPGDSAMVTGVDHGWRIGPEGCCVSIILLGTPTPAGLESFRT